MPSHEPRCECVGQCGSPHGGHYGPRCHAPDGGVVMRLRSDPEVWGRARGPTLPQSVWGEPETVTLVPSPSGPLLCQRCIEQIGAQQQVAEQISLF